MRSLRLFRLCYVHATCNQAQAPILHKSYKGCKVTGFRSLFTETTTRFLSANSLNIMTSTLAQNHTPVSYQNLVVMRHGDRFDNFDPSWLATAARRWDPPLSEPGRKRAFETGGRICRSVGFPIGRIFVSPFLRCVQTAVEVVASLSTVDEGCAAVTGDGVTVNPSKVKVSVEFGLSEMMNSKAIRPNVAPKDGNMSFDIAELEAMLPAETVDKNVERVYKELPPWEESVLQAGARYQHLMKDLADKYPTENLLLVTHGEGVKVAVSSVRNDAEVKEVDYCGYVVLRRPIFKENLTFTTGEFNLLTPSGQTGVSYFLPPPLRNDTNQASQ